MVAAQDPLAVGQDEFEGCDGLVVVAGQPLQVGQVVAGAECSGPGAPSSRPLLCVEKPSSVALSRPYPSVVAAASRPARRGPSSVTSTVEGACLVWLRVVVGIQSILSPL
jgi:hypothetical protein